MTPFSTRTALAVLLPLAITVGCGGGAGTSVQPVAGAANEQPTDNTTGGTDNTVDPVTDTTDQSAAPAATVSGRVADGYLQGAVVCVDINENGACDADEPSAISGAGGTYELDIPDGETDKPIIADVPATAIDEDTGEPIGKKLILSTPADRPEFISPITTLVHEELKDNPNLTVEEAEGSVKEELGLSGAEGAGLFEDYVANQRNDDGDAEDYRFLHQTARVIASMMDDIQDQVEQAATENGLDFASDADTRKAMRQLVRKEVRELLPDISLAVAEAIQQRESASESDTDTSETPVLVDADALVERLERKESNLDVIEKIDAIREQSEVTQVAVKDILQQGMYWLEVECHQEEIYESEEFDSEPVSPVEIILDDDGAPSPVDLPQDCYAEYGHITVEGANNELVENTYEYDADTSTWVERSYEEDDEVFAFQLIDGEWVAATSDGPSGPVEFLDDGGAVLDSGLGKMLVYATSHSLDNTRVLHHIYRLGGTAEFSELIGEDALFPEGSAVHHLGVKRKALTHVLMNWAPHDDESNCEQYNGNCNVVDVVDDAGFAPATSLDALREQSLYGVQIHGAMHNHYQNRPIDLELLADATAADGLPESGTAVWFMPPHQQDVDEYTPDEYNPDGSEYYPDQYNPDGSEYYPDPDYPEEPAFIDCIADGEPVDADDGRPKCSDFEIPHPPECAVDIIDSNFDEQRFEEEIQFEQEILNAVDDHRTADGALLSDDTTFNHEDGTVVDLDSTFDQLNPDGTEPPVPAPHCYDGSHDLDAVDPDDQFQFDDADGTGVRDQSYPDDGTGTGKELVGKTEWKLITVDGVTMIEIGMPVRVKHETDADDFAALLLIEESGYVRRGARLRDIDTDDAVMYTEAAFATLQSVAEDYVSQ